MDIDGDGIVDILSGSYMGKITYYKGTKDGFEAPQELKQTTDIKNKKEFMNYLFTNPTFSDYNGDGLLDAFIGGAKGMRYMINEGTKENPIFGERVPILDVDGNQISIIGLTVKDREDRKPNSGMTTPDFKTYVHHIDWDNDGIKDIIATTGYSIENIDPVMFFKGIETKDGIRFGKRTPLFTAADGSKVFNGTILIPYFYDINKDGALDLLLGISILHNKNNEMVNLYTIDGKEKGKGHVMLMLSKKRYK